MIDKVEVLDVPEQLPKDDDTVISGSQSIASDASCSSADIAVKSSDVKVSVTFHVIVDPSGTLAVDVVLVPLAATERFEDNVV